MEYFSPKATHQVYCSAGCRPVSKILGLSSGTIGAIGENLVAADLLLKGFYVFRAVSPACYCDLIAERNGDLLYVEVRTTVKRNGRFYFPPKHHANVHCFALWDKETMDITYLRPKTFEEMHLL